MVSSDFSKVSSLFGRTNRTAWKYLTWQDLRQENQKRNYTPWWMVNQPELGEKRNGRWSFLNCETVPFIARDAPNIQKRHLDCHLLSDNVNYPLCKKKMPLSHISKQEIWYWWALSHLWVCTIDRTIYVSSLLKISICIKTVLHHCSFLVFFYN